MVLKDNYILEAPGEVFKKCLYLGPHLLPIKSESLQVFLKASLVILICNQSWQPVVQAWLKSILNTCMFLSHPFTFYKLQSPFFVFSLIMPLCNSPGKSEILVKQFYFVLIIYLKLKWLPVLSRPFCCKHNLKLSQLQASCSGLC